ncbi:MAG: hypothetical protein O3A70_05125 [Bacteroidetes bacterium]|nr:hypothetical protein [Bacteroidota bacterium]
MSIKNIQDLRDRIFLIDSRIVLISNTIEAQQHETALSILSQKFDTYKMELKLPRISQANVRMDDEGEFHISLGINGYSCAKIFIDPNCSPHISFQPCALIKFHLSPHYYEDDLPFFLPPARVTLKNIKAVDLLAVRSFLKKTRKIEQYLHSLSLALQPIAAKYYEELAILHQTKYELEEEIHDHLLNQ